MRVLPDIFKNLVLYSFEYIYTLNDFKKQDVYYTISLKAAAFVIPITTQIDKCLSENTFRQAFIYFLSIYTSHHIKIVFQTGIED